MITKILRHLINMRGDWSDPQKTGHLLYLNPNMYKYYYFDGDDYYYDGSFCQYDTTWDFLRPEPQKGLF